VTDDRLGESRELKLRQFFETHVLLVAIEALSPISSSRGADLNRLAICREIVQWSAVRRSEI
jgi:hypothetical protein